MTYNIILNPNSEFPVTIFMPFSSWADRDLYTKAVALKFFLLRKGKISCRLENMYGFLTRQDERYFYNIGKKEWENDNS